MADITLLPSAKVPLIYQGDTMMTTEWYRFFWNVYGFTGAGVVPVDRGGTGLNTIGNHQLIIGNADSVFEPALLSSSSINISYPAGFINLELGTSTVSPGTYGSSTQVGVFTVNQYGVLTAASNTTIGIDADQIISGTLSVVRGGTGQSTYTNGQLLIGNTINNTLNKATLTAGTGITITNGAGAITITATSAGGTVTSVAALTLGTTGTDLSSTVANPTTTPVITLNVPTASATNRGALSAADWTTFNNKTSNLGTVTSVAATVPSIFSISGSPITTSGTLAITYSGTALPVANGGTGLTSTPSNGQLDIGNGTGFTRSTLTAGAGITVTNGSGSISIAAIGGNSITSYAYTATAGQTVFTGLSYTPGNNGLSVYVNGSKQLVSVNYVETNTTTVTFASGLNVDDVVEMEVIAAIAGLSGVTGVTGTAPIVSTGGSTPAISMPAATTSVSGYLTSTDWTTFNNKQAALVSGTNIKTVGGTSLLGSGDVNTIGNATNAVNVAITDDTTTNSNYYVTFVTASSGNTGIKTSASKLKYNPSTGALTASIIYIAP